MDTPFMLSFLRTLGISQYEIPYNFLEECHSYTENTNELERWFTNNDSLSFIGAKRVCIKDIVGTNHPSYENKSWIDAFLGIEDGKEIIELYQNHPSYYFDDLKQIKQSSLIHNAPLEVFEVDHEYYIKGGNSRILLLKMLYFAELNHLKLEAKKEGWDSTEIEKQTQKTNEKYSFYMQVNKIPENREVISLIFYLKKNGMHFEKIGKEECHYLSYIGKSSLEINSFSELKQLFKNSFSLTTIKTKEKLIETLNHMVEAYTTSIPELHLENVFLEVFPNFEKLKTYFLYTQTHHMKNILEQFDISRISYQNLFSYFEKIFLEEEEKSFRRLFTDCKSFSELYGKINSHPFTKRRISQDAVLQDFVLRFNKMVNFLNKPSYLPRTYEETVQYIVGCDLNIEYRKLLPSLELEVELKEKKANLCKIRTILEHKDTLIPLCSQYENSKRNMAQEKTYAHIENENLTKKSQEVTEKKETLTKIKKKKGLAKTFAKKERKEIEADLLKTQKAKKEIENSLLISQKNSARNKHIMENCLKELHVLLPSDITFDYVESVLQDESLSLELICNQIDGIELQLIVTNPSQKLEQLKQRAAAYGIVLEEDKFRRRMQ